MRHIMYATKLAAMRDEFFLSLTSACRLVSVS